MLGNVGVMMGFGMVKGMDKMMEKMGVFKFKDFYFMLMCMYLVIFE